MTEGISYKKCTYNEEERKMREKDCRIYRIRQERIKKLAEEKTEENLWQKVLMISSTLPQEGKSMTAVNLALVFVQHEKKTVLIDADLRRPSVAGILGLQEQQGLAEYLKGTAKLEEILVKREGLTVIGGGKKHGNISNLMDEKRMEELMKHLRAEFDYIIIDTPPSYLFSDAAILATYTDSVLYVVRHDMAELPQVKKGYFQIREHHQL